MYLGELEVASPEGLSTVRSSQIDVKDNENMGDVKKITYYPHTYTSFHGLAKDEDRFEFSLCTYIGNCGALIMNGLYGDFKRGIANAVEIAKKLGYTQIQYSATKGQRNLVQALLSNGFIALTDSAFVNNRSGNEITLYVYTIQWESNEIDY